MSTLYVVATPIGNLEDISPRALRILSEVDVILCEDTRVTRKLLSHFGISTKTISYHARTEVLKLDYVLSFFEEGKNVALVSDAGTPAISDPGAILVKEVRKKFPEVNIVAIPGPSALTAAVSIAGLLVSDFTFLGFLPHKKGRETLFKEIRESSRTMVFYESPHRIEKTLESLSIYLAPDRTVSICRELTKMYESVISGNPDFVKNHFATHTDQVRGEFVVIVSPK